MYLLDTNVFIEAYRTYYAPGIAPGYWDWLAGEAQGGQTICSIDAVRQELGKAGKKDPLAAWAGKLPRGFWLKARGTPFVSAYAELSQWAAGPDSRYTSNAQNTFLNTADSYLVAQAKATGGTVVTRELPSPESKARILIPDACNQLGVPYTDPFSMCLALGLQLK